jgi:hypothetical protein
VEVDKIDFNLLEWRKKKNYAKSKKKLLCSLSKKLEKEGKTTQEFEVMLNQLSLEEIIGLKLELAAKSFGGGIFGHPLWYSLKDVVRDALLKYYWSVADYHREAYAIMGITRQDYIKIIKKYHPDTYFGQGDVFEKTNTEKK